MDVVSMYRPSILEEGIISDPRFWGSQAGYEFQLNAGTIDLVTAHGSTNDGLSGYGWLTTSLVFTDGTGCDLLSPLSVSTELPTRMATNAALDLLASPRIFGSYGHALQASRFLGYMPTTLNCEILGRFTTNTSAVEDAGFGFMATTVGVIVANVAVGTGSMWAVKGNTGEILVSSIAKDTNWHSFQISINATTVSLFVDGVSGGTGATPADLFPVRFNMYAQTTNRMELAKARVWYS